MMDVWQYLAAGFPQSRLDITGLTLAMLPAPHTRGHYRTPSWKPNLSSDYLSAFWAS
jgi:hypothetical protein